MKLPGCAVVGAAFTLTVASAQRLSPIEQLGKALLLDNNLSSPPGQSCAARHVPEVEENVNTAELGDLKLTDAEEDAIVAFLKTLTDGYMP